VTCDIFVYALFALDKTRLDLFPMLIDTPTDVIQPGASKMTVVDVSMSKEEASYLEDIPQIKRWTVHSMQHELPFRSVP
jgi:hypothetical protein